MITVTANARNAVYTSDDLITSGSIGIPVRFELSADFDGLSCIAVFQGSGESIDVALTASRECVVPHEVVAISGGYLRIGVYGRNGDGTIAIPTVWAEAKRILKGAVPSGVDPSEPTPDWTAQVQQMATEALEIAQNVEDMSVEAETLPPGSPLNVEKTIDPGTGAVTLTFYLAPGRDGVSPTIAVTEITGGHRVTITDAQGTRFFDVLNGTNGRGIASAVMNADYTLTLTYTDGTSYTTPSLRGTPGADGISPTISVTDITGGHRVTITDATGAHSFDVMDGEGAVQDVQVDGVSVLQDGVANVPVATQTTQGVAKGYGNAGVNIDAFGNVSLAVADNTKVKAGASNGSAISPGRQHMSTFYGLAKAAGADMASVGGATVGVYPEAQKSAISQMLGAPVTVTGSTPSITALPGIRYVCGEVATLDITLPASGIVDVVFQSGATPTVLSGLDNVRWTRDFDPDNLDANTTYEINIADGLGVAASWT